MNEYLFEPFLTQYFLLEAICEGFLTETDRRDMYYKLAEIFCLSDAEDLEDYYNDSQLEHFSEIKNSAAYERLCRTIEFAQRSGQDIELTHRDKTILAQKREAMAIKSELFRQVKNLSKETVSTALLTMALNGNIDAMALLSYLEYNGLCACKDTCSAVRRIRLCAKWNNLFGNLLGIAYDSENKQKYYNILYTVFRNASQKQVFNQICKAKKFDNECQKDSVARTIEKAFGLGIIRRNIYDQVFAKVAFSQIVSAEYKEKLLLNKQKDAIVSLSNIPFDAELDGKLAFDEDCLKAVALKRDSEIRKMLLNIAVAKNCPAEAYVPLFIMSADEYVTEMYCDAIKEGFSSAAVVEIDAAAFCSQDFSGSGENIFLRGLSETKSANTVFILKNCEELNESSMEELLKVLDYDYRKKFKLFKPTVSLDLSGLKFCLFATGRNSMTARLAECCDTVCTERISSLEKTLVVDSVFETRAQSFGCTAVAMEQSCKDFLTNYDAKQIQKIIDGTLRIAVFENKDTISLETVKSVCEEQNIASPRKGFGYMGGNVNA